MFISQFVVQDAIDVSTLNITCCVFWFPARSLAVNTRVYSESLNVNMIGCVRFVTGPPFSV